MSQGKGRWSTPEEREMALALPWDEFRRHYPDRNKQGWYDLRRPRPDPEPGATQVTIQTSDWHFGDTVQLLRTWRECHVRAVAVDAARHKPDKIVFVINGDMTAGKGIFRKQSDRIILQNPDHQALWAAYEWARIHRLALDIAPVVEHRVNWGNHDDSSLSDLARRFVEYLSIMGVPCEYYPQEHVGSFAIQPRKGTFYHATHSFGGSDYYAQSYSALREMWRLQPEFADRQGVHINRFLRAHTHFLQVGLVVGWYTWADTAGGWHAQRRYNLSKATRNTGVIMHVDNGLETTHREIYANPDILWPETKSPELEAENTRAAWVNVAEAQRYLEAARQELAANTADGFGTWLANQEPIIEETDNGQT
jgi:hypothetical protein